MRVLTPCPRITVHLFDAALYVAFIASCIVPKAAPGGDVSPATVWLADRDDVRSAHCEADPKGSIEYLGIVHGNDPETIW